MQPHRHNGVVTAEAADMKKDRLDSFVQPV